MNSETRDRLLHLNRQFYAAVAQPFDATRQAHTPGKRALVNKIGAAYPHLCPDGDPLQMIDAGCGNGRLAFMLEDLARPVAYLGVDGEAQLLARAADNTRQLQHVQPHFVQADLAAAGWPAVVADRAPFHAVVCLATLQHLPGYDLRRQLVAHLASLLAPGGQFWLSAWQFLESERLRSRLLDWSTAGIAPDNVEPGDALLPWRQDVYAVRYVHQIDEAEMAQLATDAGLQVLEHYRADGREGNLNLYVRLGIPETHAKTDYQSFRQSQSTDQ